MSDRYLTELENLKQILANGNVEQKIDALLDAFAYGEAGLDLVITALEDRSREIRSAAYWLLEDREEAKIKESLYNYLPYQYCYCIHDIKTNLEDRYGYNLDLIDSDNKLLFTPSGNNLVWHYGQDDRININFFDLNSNEPKYDKFCQYIFGDIDLLTIELKKNYIIHNSQHYIIVKDLKSGIINPEFESILENSINGAIFGCDSNSPDCFAITSDAKILIIGNLKQPLNSCITFCSLPSTKQIYRLEGHKFRIRYLLLSPDDKLLLSQTSKTNYMKYSDSHRLWNLENRELIRTYKTSEDWIADYIAVTPNEEYLACGMRDNFLKVWDLMTDEVLYSLKGNSPSTMSPDGRVLVCAENNNVLIYDLLTQEIICTLKGHQDKVTHIALSPDKQAIASYSQDGTIKIWGIPDL